MPHIRYGSAATTLFMPLMLMAYGRLQTGFLSGLNMPLSWLFERIEYIAGILTAIAHELLQVIARACGASPGRTIQRAVIPENARIPSVYPGSQRQGLGSTR